MNLEIKFKHIFWLLILSISWGANYLFVKLAVKDLMPLKVMVVRGVSASLFLAIALIFLKKPYWKHINNLKLQRVCIVCGALIAYMWYTMAKAETTLTASMTSLLIVATPIFAWFIATFIYREKPFYLKNVLGIVIGLIGLCVMIGIHNIIQGHNNLYYILLYISGLFGFVVSAALSSHTCRNVDAFIVVIYTVFYTTLFLLLILIFTGKLQGNYTTNSILAACGTGVISTGFGYLIYFWLVADAGQIFAASNGYLVPISGFLLGVLILNEPAFLHQIIGLFIIFIGTYLANKSKKPLHHAK